MQQRVVHFYNNDEPYLAADQQIESYSICRTLCYRRREREREQYLPLKAVVSTNV